MCNIATALALSATILGSIVMTPPQVKALTLVDHDTNMTVNLGYSGGEFYSTNYHGYLRANGGDGIDAEYYTFKAYGRNSSQACTGRADIHYGGLKTIMYMHFDGTVSGYSKCSKSGLTQRFELQ